MSNILYKKEFGILLLVFCLLLISSIYVYADGTTSTTNSVTYGKNWENRTFTDGRSVMINGVSNVYYKGEYKPFYQVYNLQRDGRFIKIIGSDFNVTLDWGIIQTNGVYRDSAWILLNYPSVESKLNKKTLRNLITWNMSIDVSNLPALVKNNVKGFYFKLHSVEGNIGWSDVKKVEREGDGYNYSVIVLKDAVLNFKNPAKNGINVTINKSYIIYNDVRNAVANGEINIDNSFEHLNNKNLNISAKFIGYDKGMDVEIDKDNLNLYKWNRKSRFKINLGNSSEGLVWENNSFKNAYPGYEIIQYPKNNNSFEFEIKLNSIPPRNWINFDIDTAGLDFYYQHPLNVVGYPGASSCNATDCVDSNGINMAHRPENVVGSYAVYSKTLKNNEYKTGKLFHIYRPYVNDSAGNLIWANITINETTGKMKIEVPQSYLNTAVYPVTIDPTFGYTTAGAGQGTATPYRYLVSWIYGLDTGVGELQNISVYGDSIFGPDSDDYTRAQIWTKGDTVDNSNLAYESEIGLVPEGPIWYNLSISGTLNGGTTYMISVSRNESTTYSNRIYYDDGAYGDSKYLDDTDFNAPSTLSGAGSSSLRLSVYAIYTENDTCTGGNCVLYSNNDLADLLIGDGIFPQSNIGFLSKWNISKLNSEVSSCDDINSAKLQLYISGKASTPDSDFRAWYIRNQTWTEDNNFSQIDAFTKYNETTSGTLSSTTASTYTNLSILTQLKSACERNDNYMTVRIEDPDYLLGTLTGENNVTTFKLGNGNLFSGASYTFPSREGTNGQRPMLFISYTPSGGGTDNPPAITLNSPPDTTTSSNTSYIFNFTATDDRQIDNVTLQIFNSTGLFNSTVNTTTGTNINYLINVSNFIPDTYKWNVIVVDNGSQSTTASNFTLTVITSDTTNPLISFVSPTNSNASTISTNHVEVNTSIKELNLNKVKFNWNGTNYTLFSNKTLIYLNFNNLSSLGENATIVKDISKYQNNGTGINTTVVNGRYGKAYDFTKTNATVNISYDSSIFTNNNFAMSLWFKINAFNSGVNQLVDFGDIRNLDFDGTAKNINAYDGHDLTGTTTLVADTWYNVVFTTNSTTRRIYLNGVLENTDTLISSLTDPQVPIYLGWHPALGRSFNGTIDNFILINRSLTTKEIEEMYFSNFEKTDSTNYTFYINQSKNATSGLADGTYTYSVNALDNSNNYNTTDVRTITISSANYNIVWNNTKSNLAINKFLQGTDWTFYWEDKEGATISNCYIEINNTNYTGTASGSECHYDYNLVSGGGENVTLMGIADIGGINYTTTLNWTQLYYTNKTIDGLWIMRAPVNDSIKESGVSYARRYGRPTLGNGQDVGEFWRNSTTDNNGDNASQVDEERHCGAWGQIYFDEPNISEGKIENYYCHMWDYSINSNSNQGFAGNSTNDMYDAFTFIPGGSVYDSNLFANPGSANYYHLRINYQTWNYSFLTQNDFWNLSYKIAGQNIQILSYKNLKSWCLINLPSNDTLKTMDSDSDGLSDFKELFVTYTNPYDVDTDKDGFSDYYEYNNGKDGWDPYDWGTIHKYYGNSSAFYDSYETNSSATEPSPKLWTNVLSNIFSQAQKDNLTNYDQNYTTFSVTASGSSTNPEWTIFQNNYALTINEDKSAIKYLVFFVGGVYSESGSALSNQSVSYDIYTNKPGAGGYGWYFPGRKGPTEAMFFKSLSDQTDISYAVSSLNKVYFRFYKKVYKNTDGASTMDNNHDFAQVWVVTGGSYITPVDPTETSPLATANETNITIKFDFTEEGTNIVSGVGVKNITINGTVCTLQGSTTYETDHWEQNCTTPNLVSGHYYDLKYYANTSTSGDISVILNNAISYGQILSRYTADSFSLNSILGRLGNIKKALTDNAFFSDSLVKNWKLIKVISDPFSLNDFINKFFFGTKTNTNSINLGDTEGSTFSGFRYLTNPMSFLDSIRRIFAENRISSISLSISDAINRFFFGSKTNSNSVNLGITDNTVFEGFRSLANPMSFLDSVKRIFVGNGLGSNSISVNNFASRLFLGSKTNTNQVTLDSVMSRIFVGRRSGANQITFDSFVNRLLFGSRSSLNFINLNDIINRFFFGQRLNSNIITVNDTLNSTNNLYLLDIVDPAVGSQKSVLSGDNVTIKFNFTKFGNPITSNVNVTSITIGGDDCDSIDNLHYDTLWEVNCTVPTETTGLYDLILNANYTIDNVNRIDSETNVFSYGGIFSRLVSETFSFTDAIEVAGKLIRNPKTIIGLNILPLRESNIFKLMADSINLEDTLNRLIYTIKNPTEDILFGIDSIRNANLKRLNESSINFGEESTRLILLNRILNNDISFNDVVSSLYEAIGNVYSRAVDNTINFNLGTFIDQLYVRVINNQINMNFLIGRTTNLFKNIVNQLIFSINLLTSSGGYPTLGGNVGGTGHNSCYYLNPDYTCEVYYTSGVCPPGYSNTLEECNSFKKNGGKIIININNFLNEVAGKLSPENTTVVKNALLLLIVLIALTPTFIVIKSRKNKKIKSRW